MIGPGYRGAALLAGLSVGAALVGALVLVAPAGALPAGLAAPVLRSGRPRVHLAPDG